MRYYIADCHFFHENLLQEMDKRGFASVQEMNAYMIKKWNAKVNKRDEVVILGDFSIGSPAQTNEILDQLQGKLHLIVGNHDRRYLYSKDFHSERFEWIHNYMEMNDNNRKVILSHYPMPCYNGQYIVNKEEQPKTYMLYGHVHDSHDEQLVRKFIEMTEQTTVVDREGVEKKLHCNMINCFCKYSDYVPLTLDEWIAKTQQLRYNK